MATLPHRQTMSVEEYLDLDRRSIETRYEYIDGVELVSLGVRFPLAKLYRNVVLPENMG